jgi:hypothetical protein
VFGFGLPAQAEPLVISSVTVQEAPIDVQFQPSGAGVKITWLTNYEAKARVEFGLTDAYGYYVQSSASPRRLHEVVLSGLKGETTYHFRLVAEVSGLTPLYSFDQTFRTSRYINTVKPVLSNVRVTYVGATYFIVTWVSDELSGSAVNVSQSDTMVRSWGVGGNGNTTQHEVVVGGLQKGTTYYGIPYSDDSDGNRGTGSQFVVTTAPSDAGQHEPLLVSQVSPVSWPDKRISATAITFTWHTNQPSRATVEVRGPGGKRVDETGFLATDHTLSVVGLQPDTTYLVSISAGDIFRQGASVNDIALHTASAGPQPKLASSAPQSRVLGVSTACTNPNAYGVQCRDLALERRVAAQLKASLERYFQGTVPPFALQNWFTLVKAATYGRYPSQALIQYVRFGGKTVHPTIPWGEWRNSPEYKAYITR